MTQGSRDTKHLKDINITLEFPDTLEALGFTKQPQEQGLGEMREVKNEDNFENPHPIVRATKMLFIWQTLDAHEKRECAAMGMLLGTILCASSLLYGIGIYLAEGSACRCRKKRLRIVQQARKTQTIRHHPGHIGAKKTGIFLWLLLSDLQLYISACNSIASCGSRTSKDNLSEGLTLDPGNFSIFDDLRDHLNIHDTGDPHGQEPQDRLKDEPDLRALY